MACPSIFVSSTFLFTRKDTLFLLTALFQFPQLSILARDWYKARVWLLLVELPEGGGSELLRIERRVMDNAELGRLALELSDKWKSLTRHKRV